MKWFSKRSWLLLLMIAFLATLYLPSTREAHILSFRMVFPMMRGKTFVQGEPGGCILYVIPNVQFSEGYREELFQKSDQTPNDFILATAAGEQSKLKIPPASTWINHPLKEWGAWRCSYLQSSQQANAKSRQEALQLVHLAQNADPTNGALWLAEALVLFRSGQDEAALNALKIAAERPNWRPCGKEDFEYVCKVLQNAGLSELDAAMEANLSLMDNFISQIQGSLKEQLQRLMADAVISTNNSEFSRIFNLLVELRKANWSERNVALPNGFRYFAPRDELLEAMRKRMKMEPEPSSDYIVQGEFRERVFRDNLTLETNQTVVGEFWGQADVAQTEKKLRKEIRQGPSYHREMLCMAHTILSGASAALFLYFVAIAVLQELPFLWLRKTGGIHGIWPKPPTFWVCTIVLLTAGVALGTNFFDALGMFNEGGLTLEPRSSISPLAKAFWTSTVVSMVWFTAQLFAWKIAKKPWNAWPVAIVLAFGYLICVVVMAYFRLQLTDWISSSL